MKVLLAIPTFRCAPQIIRVIENLHRSRNLRKSISQVVIFDNQSGDSTATEANRIVQTLNLNNWIEVRINSINRGLGGTQKLALKWALENNFSHIVIFHGDDQGEVTDIERVLNELVEDWDAVLGSRFMHGAHRIGYSRVRIFGNLVLNALFTVFTGRKIFDLGSGLNGFKIKAIETSLITEFSDGFNFNVDLLLYLIRCQKHIKFIPITWKEVDQISNAKNWQVARIMVLSLLRWKFHTKLINKKDMQQPR